MKTLERCLSEKIDREMNNIVDTVEDRIQNAILTAINNVVTPKIELAIRSINASSGRDATSVLMDPESREHVGINTPCGSVSGDNETQAISELNDEARHNIQGDTGRLSVLETHFDQQPHTHHTVPRAMDGSQNNHHTDSLIRVSYEVQ